MTDSTLFVSLRLGTFGLRQLVTLWADLIWDLSVTKMFVVSYSLFFGIILILLTFMMESLAVPFYSYVLY